MSADSTPTDALPSNPRSADSIESWWGEYDVVVVGFGVAGGAAAIEAQRAGAATLILERATRGGGATALRVHGVSRRKTATSQEGAHRTVAATARAAYRR